MVIIEVMMPGLDAVSALYEIRWHRLNARSSIPENHSSRDLVWRASKYHVNGYIFKGDAPEATDYAIRSALYGCVYVPPSPDCCLHLRLVHNTADRISSAERIKDMKA